MSKTLTEIAQQLKASDKKVQLIYAFNGSGKTRLSREFKDLISPKTDDRYTKVLYYNAFTEDLFYWDNDLEPKLNIQKNKFIDWILKIQGDQGIIENFQRYTDEKLMPKFIGVDVVQDGKKTGEKTYPEVTFSYKRGDDTNSGNIKISKGEESNFIWSIFYSLLYQIIEVLNTPEINNRATGQYNQLEYVFIDDPVTSLDENHLIELAVNLAELIKSAPAHLKFVITTHNPLFYNVLHNELDLKKKGKKDGCYLLEKLEDGTYNLDVKYGDSNKSFFYHLYLKKIIEKAIADNQIEKFHFTLLRNLYEKTASFLGYAKWQDLLETAPGDKDAYLKRIITFSSHRTLSSEEVRDPTGPEKQTVKLLLDNLIDNYGYWPKKEDANGRTN